MLVDSLPFKDHFIVLENPDIRNNKLTKKVYYVQFKDENIRRELRPGASCPKTGNVSLLGLYRP